MGPIVVEILNLIILFDNQLWLCAKKNVESRRYLNDILPPDFMYKVTAYSIIESLILFVKQSLQQLYWQTFVQKKALMISCQSTETYQKQSITSKMAKGRMVNIYYQIAGSRKCSHEVWTKFNPATNEDTSSQTWSSH